MVASLWETGGVWSTGYIVIRDRFKLKGDGHEVMKQNSNLAKQNPHFLKTVGTQKGAQSLTASQERNLGLCPGLLSSESSHLALAFFVLGPSKGRRLSYQQQEAQEILVDT